MSRKEKVQRYSYKVKFKKDQEIYERLDLIFRKSSVTFNTTFWVAY